MMYNIISSTSLTTMFQPQTNHANMKSKSEKAVLGPNEFSFYLDAWLYCIKNSISLEKILRKNWDVWKVEV